MNELPADLFALSWLEAAAVGDDAVATQHLLLALLRQAGPVAEALADLGADYERVMDHAYRRCTVFSHHGRPRAGREPTLGELLVPPTSARRLPLPPTSEEYRQQLSVVRHRKEAAIDA